MGGFTSRAGTPKKSFSGFFSHRGLVVSGGILGLIFIGAVFAPLLSAYDPYTQDLANRHVPPVWHERGTWEHFLGTDALGRDYWTRLLYGARASLFIGFVAATIAGLLGVTLGVGAGYFGGRIDAAITFLINLRLSLPVILVALAVVALFSGTFLVIVLLLGCLLWDRYAVVTRTLTKQLKEKEFIASSVALGSSRTGIIAKDILPNLANHLIVVWTLEIAHAILLEAALSFLGLGVQPPTPSWGLMVSEGKDLLFFEGWLIAIPGCALFLLVLSINLVGDGIRDVTAPENLT